MAMGSKRLWAVLMLALATAGWGLSFPTVKALTLMQEPLLPASGSWFPACLTLAIRFGAAALLMGLVCARDLRRLTALEIEEGVGLGVLTSLGLIFQMDGLAHTSASTSAFLTQFYCLLIPLWVAWRERRCPSLPVIASCLMVMTGVTVLSGLSWRDLRLGRGELETLIGSTFFAGQILWLHRSKYRENNVNNFSVVMFAVIAAVCFVGAWATRGAGDSWTASYRSTPAIGFLVILTLVSTVGSFVLMNYWQTKLPATHAGVIYTLEPIFASLFALFLPGVFSAWASIDYADEVLGGTLLLGGGLIAVANILIHLKMGNMDKSEDGGAQASGDLEGSSGSS
jgi:drug/metabolite transporter (DMT)-like permease